MIKSYSTYSIYYTNNKKNRVSYIGENKCNKCNNFSRKIILFCDKKLKKSYSTAVFQNKCRISTFLKKIRKYFVYFVLILRDFSRISVNKFFDEKLTRRC